MAFKKKTGLKEMFLIVLTTACLIKRIINKKELSAKSPNEKSQIYSTIE